MRPIISITGALAIASPLAHAAPLEPRAAASNPYGINPAKPFTLTALAADNSKSWQLNTYKVNATSVALRAYRDDAADTNKPAASTFTLVASHYGTQLHTTIGSTTYSSDTPTAKTLYTFHAGADNEPFAGGLEFLGVYHGGDPEAGSLNIVKSAADLSLADFSVCPSKGGREVVRYQAVADGCVSVILEAYAA